jgi:hypothetical protein
MIMTRTREAQRNRAADATSVQKSIEKANKAAPPAQTKAPDDGTLNVPSNGGWTDFGSQAKSNEYKTYQSAMQNAGGFYKGSAAGDPKAHKGVTDGKGGKDSRAATMTAQQDFVASGLMPKDYQPSGSIDAPTKAAFAALKGGNPEFPAGTPKATVDRMTRLGAAMRETPGKFLSKSDMDAAVAKPVGTMPQIPKSEAAMGTANPPLPKNSVEAMGGMNQVYNNLQNSLAGLPGGQEARNKLATELSQGKTVEGAIPSPEAMKVYDAMGQAQKQLNALPEKDRAGLQQYMDQNLPSHVKQALDAVKQGDAADAARNDPKSIAAQQAKITAAQHQATQDSISAQMKGLETMLKTTPGGMKPLLDELKKGNVGTPGTSNQANEIAQTMAKINQGISSLPADQQDYARKTLIDNAKTYRDLPLTHQALTALKVGQTQDSQRAATAVTAQAHDAAVKDLSGAYSTFDKKLAPTVASGNFDNFQRQLAGKAWPWQQQAPAAVVNDARAFSEQVNQRLSSMPAADRAAVLKTLATQYPNAGKLFGAASDGARREEVLQGIVNGLGSGGGFP